MQHIRPIQYHEPQSLAAASQMLQEQGALVLAGGTDLVVMLRRQKTRGATLVNIKKIPELTAVRTQADGALLLGALVTIAAVRAMDTPGLQVLREGCAQLGTPGVRNLATCGGNVGRASPASDIIPCLAVLEAEALIHGPSGERAQSVLSLLAGPGRLHLTPGEFIASLRISAQARGVGCYLKSSRVRGADCAQAGVAVQVFLRDGLVEKACIAMTAVGATVLRATKAEQALQGQKATAALFAEAGSIAATEAKPISDLRASADYRRHLVCALTAEALHRATGIQ